MYVPYVVWRRWLVVLFLDDVVDSAVRPAEISVASLCGLAGCLTLMRIMISNAD